MFYFVVQLIFVSNFCDDMQYKVDIHTFTGTYEMLNLKMLIFNYFNKCFLLCDKVG